MQNDLGPRLVATGTDSFAIVDPDGNVSGQIQTTPSRTVARTTDRAMAEHIRSLLIVWVRMKEKQAGTSPAN